MINILSSCAKSLSLAVIVVSILEMLLPNSKTKKYVKMVMGIYVLFSMVEPLVGNKMAFDLGDLTEEYKTEYAVSDVINQESMDKKINKMYQEQLEKDIKNKIEKMGYIVEECSVKTNIDEEGAYIKMIVLRLDKAVEQVEESFESRVVEEIQKIRKVEIRFKKRRSAKNIKFK